VAGVASVTSENEVAIEAVESCFVRGPRPFPLSMHCLRS
jgi:hypothetical protein